MRHFIFGVAIIVSLLLQAHVGEAQTSSDSGGCPPPLFINTINGYRIPPYGDMMQQLSPDGKYLAIEEQQGDGGACILNLQTLERKQIVVNGGLPGEEDIATAQIIWCPYDPDLLALTVASFVDPDSSGQSTDYVVNLFKYRVSTGESELITPDSLGTFGPDHMAFLDWLRGSTSSSDTFLIGSDPFSGLYVPQTKKLIPGALYGATTLFCISNDWKDSVWRIYNSPLTQNFMDSSLIGPTSSIVEVGNASFSPDDKLFALEVAPANYDYFQVWVYKVSDPSKPIDTINFQSLYCKYSLWDIWPVFITDSTLAVSMHTDGDESSPLWEITIDGRIIRQLTFLPEYPSGVANANLPENSISLSSFPNPLTQSTKISFTLPESGEADITIVNLLGAPVARLFSGTLSAGAHSFVWDASGFAPGIYECIVKLNGRVLWLPMVQAR